ncbi:arabinose efflux permease family protein [Caldisphaera lagunensis DSM 15908]|uniref:Arabinose efflux permease family protein n=1 Tax=Caldisphaera lagunensis (strain DSM 15908 / JCM 11604 / ANMR 0165 / IC-154) TaxID=1056495 RepID=L0A7N8_CALLD|nr:MFS transporter [Caldisphaera lagunensis]AFZ69836.1 arabinose efflux permease family protein [Caldisphaera lagunensis DSM 15908]
MSNTRNSLNYLAIIRIMRSVSAGIISIVYPYIAIKMLHFNLSTLGLVYALAALFTALFSIAFGYLADFIGRKLSLLFSSLVLTISILILLIKINFITAVIAAILGGISNTGAMAGGGIGGAVAPVQNALIADFTTRKNRTTLISLMAFFGNIAAAGGTLLGGIFSYRIELELATIISIIPLIFVYFIESQHIRAKSIKMKSGNVTLKFSITGILNGLTSGLVTPFLIPIFIVLYDVSRSYMSIYTTIASLIATFSMLLAPKIDKALGFLRSIYITRGLTIPLILIFPFIRILPVSLGIYIIFPALRVIAIPIQQSAMLSMVPPEERGRISGLNQGSRLGFSSIGTFIASPFMDISLIYLPFVSYSVFMALNIYLYKRFFGGKNGSQAFQAE